MDRAEFCSICQRKNERRGEREGPAAIFMVGRGVPPSRTRRTPPRVVVQSGSPGTVRLTAITFAESRISSGATYRAFAAAGAAPHFFGTVSA